MARIGAQCPAARPLVQARAMAGDIVKRKAFLFVDDDAGFLAGIQGLFSEMSHGSWDIFTAENHAQALTVLGKLRVDVVILDIGMPIMDGIQFLQLLGRTHPGQQVVMLTGKATEEDRRACLESGAVLFLEKPLVPDGFAALFAALDALAGALPQGGFRGMMRRVGLAEVLQMECLGRKSSVLEILTGKVHGRIFICDGAIVTRRYRCVARRGGSLWSAGAAWGRVQPVALHGATASDDRGAVGIPAHGGGPVAR